MDIGDNKFSSATQKIQVSLKSFGKEDLIIYPGRGPASVLHDFVRACNFNVEYETKCIQQPTTIPFGSIIFVDGIQHAVGYGVSKKAAKQDAARNCLELFIPNIKQCWLKMESSDQEFDRYEELEKLSVTDPCVPFCCLKLGEASPYKCLKICLERNFGNKGMDQSQLETVYKTTANENGDTTYCQMSIGPYAAEGVQRDKNTVKQIVAQKLLSQMHPLIQSFGGIIRLYGNISPTAHYLKTAKEEQNKILALNFKQETRGTINYALLAKMREEMMRVSRLPPEHLLI